MTTNQELVSRSLPGEIAFYGGRDAGLFTMEIRDSLMGVLKKSITYGGAPGENGFISASVDGRVCSGTMWSRDVGVFVRELAHWGYLEHACLIVGINLYLVEKNEQGFYAFPTRFFPNEKMAGNEVDGTASLIIGMIDLFNRLPGDHPFRRKIYDFLHADTSPLLYYVTQLEQTPFIPGSGEFGSGSDMGLLVYNVVQNGMVRLALLAGAHMEEKAGDATRAALYQRTSDTLNQKMLTHFVRSDGSWKWCILSDTMEEDEAILQAIENIGFGGINGVASMTADVLGFEALREDWPGTAVCRKTFDILHNNPIRHAQFEKYGMWIQFEKKHNGFLTSPSYGQGYAIQTMLLLDRLDMADRALHYLADATYAPPPFYVLDRQSPFYFYERYYSPEAEGQTETDQGCGALNLVNVGEPMKIARLILGVDNSSEKLIRILPRLPDSWEGYAARQWTLVTENGPVLVDIDCRKKGGRTFFSLRTHTGGRIPALQVRLIDTDGCVQTRTFTDVQEARMDV